MKTLAELQAAFAQLGKLERRRADKAAKLQAKIVALQAKHEQEAAADLYRIRAKLHRGAHAGGVADAARSHHRQRHRAADVRQEGKQPALRVRVVIEKPAAMPARFQSLRDDAVRAVCFQPARFGHAGRA